MMIRRALLWLPCVVAAAACGGANEIPLLDDSGSPEQPDSTAPDDASPEPDATTDDAKPPNDGGAADAIPDKDSSTYVDPGIACGNDECDPSQDLCCRTVTSYYPQVTYGYACEALSDVVKCAAGAGIYCDDDHDCDGGELCCGDLNYNGYAKVSCKPTCTGTVYGYQQIHFCDPKAPDCDGSQTCVASTQAPGYFVCQ